MLLHLPGFPNPRSLPSLPCSSNIFRWGPVQALRVLGYALFPKQEAKEKLLNLRIAIAYLSTEWEQGYFLGKSLRKVSEKEVHNILLGIPEDVLLKSNL